MKKALRKKSCKMIGLALVTILIIGIFTGCEAEENNTDRYDLKVVDATSDFYVNDFAGIFSEEEKKDLMNKAVTFNEETSGIQVVITTVDYLENAVKAEESSSNSYEIEEISYSMYNQYEIGTDDMGILVLFSTEDREVRIETGRNMQFYITDSISGRLLDDYGMEYFADNQFAEGLISVQSAIIDEIKDQVPNDWHISSDETVNTEPLKEEDSSEKNSKGSLISEVSILIASLAALITSIAASISQFFKGKSNKKAYKEEVESLKEEFEERRWNAEILHETATASMKLKYEEDISKKNNEINTWKSKLQEAKDQISTLKKELETMRDKSNRIQTLHPEFNFEEEVKNMIENEYKAKAEEIDTELAKILKEKPTKQNQEIFSRGISLIDSAEVEVKKYITTSRQDVNARFKEAERLRIEHERKLQEERDKVLAKEACSRIRSIYSVNTKGDYNTYNNLHKAISIYYGLTANQKEYFPDKSLISSLSRTHATAEQDYKIYQRAKEAEDKIKSIIGNIHSVDEDDRERLAKAKRIYDNLSNDEAHYFSKELLRKLTTLISDADDDHRRQKRKREDEERRRRNSYSSMSSYRGSSGNSFSGSGLSGGGFRGGGGRPSGGGASRKF